MYGIDWKDSVKEIADVRLFGGQTNTKGAKINSPNILWFVTEVTLTFKGFGSRNHLFTRILTIQLEMGH